MATSTSYAASDAEEIALHPEPNVSTIDRDRLNVWVDMSVTNEIMRGLRLREQKPPSQIGRNTRPVIIKLTKSLSNRKRRRRGSPENTHNENTCQCSHWPVISQKNKMRRTKPKNDCSMRIVQLAVPSKRHCLDTWRNKSDLLPDYMLDRLKQHVMDQRPLIQVPEAINYFKKRKQNSSKKCNITKLEFRKPMRCGDIESICVIFAKKIMPMISKPPYLKINPDLENLQTVINEEITRITKQNNHKKYREIQSNAVKQITLWVGGIMEDLKYKQLEDALIDLEEEEGPVLDFIDALVNKVMDICLPKPSREYLELNKSETNTSINAQDSIQSEVNDNRSASEDKQANTEYFRNEISKIIEDFLEEPILTDIDHFQNELNNLINNILDDPKETEDNSTNNKMDGWMEMDFDKDTSNVTDEVQNNPENGSGTSITKLEEIHNNNKNATNEIANNYENGRVKPKSASDIENSPTNSEIMFEATHKNKKVMFSISNMVSGGLKEKAYQVHINNLSKAKPELLSDADEIWPDEVFTPAVLRPSASVTQSILSLGELLESEEKNMTISDHDCHEHEMFLIDHYTAANTDGEKIAIANEEPSKEINEDQKPIIPKTNDTRADKNKSIASQPYNLNSAFNSNPSKLIEEGNEPEPKLKKNTSCLDATNKKRKSSRHKVKIKNKGTNTEPIENTTKPDRDCTVRFESGEPSEDFSPVQKKQKLTKDDIRKWCKDLDKGFKNLQNWSDWLQSTCKITNSLLKRKKGCCSDEKSKKNWAKLLRNITKDAELWQNMNQHTHQNFGRFQSYNENIDNTKLTSSLHNSKCICKNYTSKDVKGPKR